VNTFSLPRKSKGIKSLSELYDGATISLILNDIDGKHFRDAIVKGFPAGSPNAASVNWVQRFNARMYPAAPQRLDSTLFVC
jgi:hypothetical protein